MSREVPTICCKDAIKWTKKWRNTHKNDARAFLIPTADLIAAMVEMGMATENGNGTYTITPADNDIRAYLAIDPDQAEANGQKLLIVGTKKEEVNGKTIYSDMIQCKEDRPSEIEGSGIFDFTTPCPSECDPYSPLN